MASAEQLLREAQHAFGNISPGSVDRKKHAAVARRLASRIVSKYPGSVEAHQAHSILNQTGIRQAPVAAARPRRPAHPNHQSLPATLPQLPPTAQSTQTSHVAHRRMTGLGTRPKVENEPGWRNIWEAFAGLSGSKKKVLLFVVAVLFFVIQSMPFLAFVFLIYFSRPQLIKEHLFKALDSLA